MVFYVNLFYKFLIPTVVGGMALLVGMDASRKAINFRKKRHLEKQLKAAAPPPPESKAGTDVEASEAVDIPQDGQGDEVAPTSPSPSGDQLGEEADHG